MASFCVARINGKKCNKPSRVLRQSKSACLAVLELVVTDDEAKQDLILPGAKKDQYWTLQRSEESKLLPQT